MFLPVIQVNIQFIFLSIMFSNVLKPYVHYSYLETWNFWENVGCISQPNVLRVYLLLVSTTISYAGDV